MIPPDANLLVACSWENHHRNVAAEKFFQTVRIRDLADLFSGLNIPQGMGVGAAPSNVIVTGLMKPCSSNSIRSMHVTR